MSLTVSQIISSFGAYYINSGQGQKDLISQLFKKYDTAQLFQQRPTTDTIFRMSETQFTRIVQSFQKAWTPLSGSAFVPVTIPLFRLKIDVQETPDDLIASWAGFLAGDEIDRKQWPFIKWYMEKYLIPQSLQDRETNEAFFGEYIAPTPGTAGSASRGMNGIKKIINDWAGAAGSHRTTPIATGASSATAATWCGQVEAFALAIPTLYRSLPLTIAMSMANYYKFRQGKQDKYNLYYAQATDLDTLQLYPNIKVKGLHSMEGSDKIWTSPEWNKIRVTRAINNEGQFMLESVDRTLKVFTDWWEGYGFLIPELIFTNDQEMTSPDS